MPIPHLAQEVDEWDRYDQSSAWTVAGWEVEVGRRDVRSMAMFAELARRSSTTIRSICIATDRLPRCRSCGAGTRAATVETIMQTASEIYRDFPQLRAAIGLP
jgi:hypothetical protein